MDTMWLRSVYIVAPKGDSAFILSVSDKMNPSTENISVEQALSNYTPVFFKTYSPGGTASLSHRGFGATQTLLVWNGFVLNQLTLGQPAFGGMQANDNMRFGLVSGTLAASGFSGGLSSYVYIDDVFYGDSLNKRRLLVSGGSFGTGSASFFSEYRIKATRLSFEISGTNSDNNYIYLNNSSGADRTEWLLENRTAASFYNVTLKANVMTPLRKGDFRLSLWAGSQFNETPASLLSPQLPDNECQQSRFVRVSGFVPLISLDDAGLHLLFYLSADSFLYRNNQLSISDGTASQSFATRWKAYARCGEGHDFTLEYYPEINRVVSDHYSKTVLFTDQRLKLKYQLNRFEPLKVDLWAHAITRNFDEVFPLPGTSVTFMPGALPGEKAAKWRFLKVYAGLARNMRMPAVNDLYWVPGGNPDLKPEDAWMADMTLHIGNSGYWFYLKSARTDVKWYSWEVNLSPFYAQVSNLIRWTPDPSGAQWVADNVARSQHFGSEAVAMMAISWRKMMLKASLTATRVFARDVSQEETRTLLYVPDKTMNSSLSLQHGIWSGGYDFHYTGKRFSSSDNDRFMPEIFLHDVFFTVTKSIKTNQLSLSFRINNIMNADYQYIAWYPMPRRNFYVTLKWKWNE